MESATQKALLKRPRSSVAPAVDYGSSSHGWNYTIYGQPTTASYTSALNINTT